MERSILFCAITLSVFLSGCSDNLSNSQAGKIITTTIHFPVVEDEMIETGLLAVDRDSLPPYYYKLQQQGLFTVERLGKGGFLVTNYRFRVTPTAAAKPFVTFEDPAPLQQGRTGEAMQRNRYRTCEVYFQDVKTIQEIPATNSAEVRYLVQRKNLTPFWSVYLDGTHRMPDTNQVRPFKLIKTTDGWKANE